MPMGLTNAPSIFQRLMDHILEDLQFADPYIDDIIIGCDRSTPEELIQNHQRDVQLVLDKLASVEILASKKKFKCF